MSKSVYDINQERKTKYGTLNNKASMFPVGTPVQIICVAQDFNFFTGNETGIVTRNDGKGSMIIVKFDEPRQFEGGYIQKEFNFQPDDLRLLNKKPDTCPHCGGKV